MPVPVAGRPTWDTLANQFIAHRVAPQKRCLSCLASLAVMVGPDDNDGPEISLVCGLGYDSQGERGQHWALGKEEDRGSRQQCLVVGGFLLDGRQLHHWNVGWHRRKQPGTEENGGHGKLQYAALSASSAGQSVVLSVLRYAPNGPANLLE
jgi:hypothetical protein